MEQFEASSHNIASQNVQISAYTSVPPPQHQQPKSRCPHCCYHRTTYTSYPPCNVTQPTQHSPSCTCHGPGCNNQPPNCYNSVQSPPPPTACACSSSGRCSTPVVFRQHPTTSHHHQQPPPHSHPHHHHHHHHEGSGGGCPCCRRQQQQQQQQGGGAGNTQMEPPPHHHHHHHHQISRIHLTTDNVTYPTPHYATAYASLPGLHHSWEPTTGYQEAEYNIHVAQGSPIPEYHSHVHHHVNQQQRVNSDNECTERSQSYREPPSWQTYSSRHYRRHNSRLASHPYPSIIHYPVGYHYPTLSRSIIPASYLFPPRHLIPASFEVIGELDTEMTEEDWQEMEARNSEPKGLTKYEIEKLPSYFVTKSTMKDFTEDERCVVCMDEFDVGNSLRILPCAHEFHCECVDKWLETNPTCPICRATIEVT